MPRRRMLDPSFFDDTDVAKLTRDERLFLLGCIRNADDDGRLIGHAAYLKSQIFMYDEDIDLERMNGIKESTLKKMNVWQQDNIWRLIPYHNADHDYLYFPKWTEQQRPSHPTPSKLPAPPQISGAVLETPPQSSSETPEACTKVSRFTPSQSSPGQSSQGKYSIGQVSAVPEDFTKFGDENDLTDFLTKTVTRYISAGRARLLETGSYGTDVPPEKGTFNKQQMAMLVFEQFWKQTTGMKLPGTLWQGTFAALREHPIEVMARVFVKAARYHGGKHQSWKYIQTIIDEEMAKSRSP